MMQPRRAGAALVLALLVLLVLECVVVGMLHLTQLERRLADNGTTALRLRLAAETAARIAAGAWPTVLDTMPLGSLAAASSAITNDGLATTALYQRIDSSLVLVFGEAKEPAPRYGLARAALLVGPPLLSESMLPAAALSVGTDARVHSSGVIAVQPNPGCPDSLAAAALQIPDPARLRLDAGGTLAGNIDIATLNAAWLTRTRAIAAVIPSPTSTDSVGRIVYSGNGSGILALDGDLVVAANAAFHGVVLVTGSLTIEAGAILDGVVLVLGTADIVGMVNFSRCSARAAIQAAGLQWPRPHASRTAIPAF